jgi:NAD(P)-dependent dehydrogenase (short-subunit alcohol dehydrogenase family)
LRQDAAEEVAKLFPGGIDVLINNAGILGTVQPAIEQ